MVTRKSGKDLLASAAILLLGLFFLYLIGRIFLQLPW